MAEGAVKMQISLEKYEEMQDRIAQLETAIEIKSKQLNYALDLVIERDDVIYALRSNQPHWISVKDRLPECEEPVLLWTDYGEICIASRSGDGKWYGSYQIIDNAVCWMPLPEPPEVEYGTV